MLTKKILIRDFEALYRWLIDGRVIKESRIINAAKLKSFSFEM